MSTLRASLRVIFICLSTLIHYFIFVIGMLLLLPFHAAKIRWRNFMVRNWAKSAVRIMGIKITAEGRPPVPPFFLVSNHLSYIDIVVYFTQMNCIFIAKREVSSWPVLGFLAKTANTLFIDRRNHRDIARVNRLISGNINNYQGIILFAEGTSSRGESVKPFKPSLLEYPAGKNLPVSYASISYRTPPGEMPAHLSVCWWGDMTFGSHIFNVLKIPKFDAMVRFGKEVVQNQNRKILAQELWELVRKKFIPVVAPEKP